MKRISQEEFARCLEFVKTHPAEFDGGTAEDGATILTAFLDKPVSPTTVKQLADLAKVTLARPHTTAALQGKLAVAERRIDELESRLEEVEKAIRWVPPTATVVDGGAVELDPELAVFRS